MGTDRQHGGHTAKADGASAVDLYDSTYGRFNDDVYTRIRRRIWGEDIGQNGWVTTPEHDMLIARLALGSDAASKRILDVACGSGGPTLRIAAQTGASVVGVDINPAGIDTATRTAAARGIPESRAAFRVVDAGAALPFDDASFDAVICIDAINHLPDRAGVLREWRRLLRPGGRIVFVDPIVVTGALMSHEIAVRSSIGFFLFVPRGVNERAIEQAGLRLLETEDLTAAVARIAAAWHDARAEHAAELGGIEGEATFTGQQRFLATAATLAREGRLSRFMYVAAG